MEITYTYIDSDKTLAEKLEIFSQYKKVGVDIETTGLKDEDALDSRRGKIRLIQISNSEQQVLVIDCFKISDSSKNRLKEFLEDNERVKIFHNAKFDMKFLMAGGIRISNVIDTMLLAGLLEAGLKESFKLASVAYRYLNLEISKDEQVSDWGKYVLSEDQISYSAIDAGIIIPLADILMKEIKMNGLKNVAELELNALPVIIEMEHNGIKVDTNKLSLLREDLRSKHQALKEDLLKYFGDKSNLNSHSQIKKGLLARGINVINTKKITFSRLAPNHDVILKLLEYKDAAKQLEFAEKIPNSIDTITGRLHSNYFQLGAKTGRLSCTRFNLQQVPKNKYFRECFIPEENNVFVIADYSQMQIRIAAEFSQDPVMKEIYQNGEDLHRITASVLSGKDISDITKEERSLAKALNFGMMFGMGANSLVDYAWSNYNVYLTEEQAKEFISRFYEKYDGFRVWQNTITNNTFYSSRTILGRRRLFLNGGNYTQLINTPIQGVEGDILKTALSSLLNDLKGTSGKIVATIHDEIIVECNRNEGEEIAKMVRNIMEEAGEQFLKTIPVVAEATIAASWAEK